MTDVIALKDIYKESQSVDSLMLSIVESSPDCIKLVDTDGRLIFMNHNGQCAMEIDRFDAIKGAQWCNLWPEVSQNKIDDAVQKALRGESVNFTEFCPTAKGTPKWWDVSVHPVREKHGQIEKILSVSRDVTHIVTNSDRLEEIERALIVANNQLSKQLAEKNQLLQRQEELKSEVDHRIKNSLSMVASSLRLQARDIGDPKAKSVISDAVSRVQVIAKIHDKLSLSKSQKQIEVSSYFNELFEDVVEGMGMSAVNIKNRCPVMKLDSKIVTALGMITSELLTNSLKHAGETDLTVTLELNCDDPDEISLSFWDTGTGLPPDWDASTQKGLGIKIVSTYARILNARPEWGNHPDGGFLFQMRFPSQADPA